jgi:DNA polymerase III alpha subunit
LRIERIGAELGVPLLATFDAHAPERRALQDVVTCIRNGVSLDRAGLALFPNGERHLRAPEHALARFADAPELLARAADVALRASAFSLDELEYRYPSEVTDSARDAMQHLMDLSWEGARERYAGAVPEVKRYMRLASELLGFPRHLGQHVGGFVITEDPLCELVPIENAAMPDRTVIEWDKDDIDALGILKVDVLGLGMLTAFRKSFELIESSGDEDSAGGRFDVPSGGSPCRIRARPCARCSRRRSVCRSSRSKRWPLPSSPRVHYMARPPLAMGRLLPREEGKELWNLRRDPLPKDPAGRPAPATRDQC